jgi:hypothetical protein
MCDLRDQQRASPVTNIAPKPDEEPAGEIHWSWIRDRRERLEQRAKKNKEATYGSPSSSTGVISNVWSEQEHDETAEPRHRTIETQFGSSRMSEICGACQWSSRSSISLHVQSCHAGMVCKPFKRLPSYPRVVEPKNRKGISKYNLRS